MNAEIIRLLTAVAATDTLEIRYRMSRKDGVHFAAIKPSEKWYYTGKDFRCGKGKSQVIISYPEMSKYLSDMWSELYSAQVFTKTLIMKEFTFI